MVWIGGPTQFLHQPHLDQGLAASAFGEDVGPLVSGAAGMEGELPKPIVGAHVRRPRPLSAAAALPDETSRLSPPKGPRPKMEQRYEEVSMSIGNALPRSVLFCLSGTIRHLASLRSAFRRSSWTRRRAFAPIGGRPPDRRRSLFEIRRL